MTMTAIAAVAAPPNGKAMTIAGWEQLFSLFSIEGVPEVRRSSNKKES